MHSIQYLLPTLRTAIFSGLLLGATTGFAQSQQQPSAAELATTAHDPMATYSLVQGKTTQNPGRLIATSAYNAADTVLAPSDSAQYSYAGDVYTLPDRVTSFRFYTGIWYTYSRFLYAYDGAGLNTTTEYELWSSSSLSFIKTGKYTYTYNASGKKTGMTYELWDRIAGAYGNGLRETYTLDAANNMVDFLQEIWDPANAKWNNNQHIIQTFNAQAGVTDYILQLWDGITLQWVNKTHIASIYDAGGLHLQMQNTEIWDRTNLCWQPSQRTSNGYNASHYVSLATIELYSLTDSLFHPYQKDSYTYTASNRVATHMIAIWDQSAHSYINSTNATYTYNTNAQNTLITTRTWISGSWAVGIGSRNARNYYEGSSVLGTASAKMQIDCRATPNPAVSVLHVSLAAAGKGQPANALLTDMLGNTLRYFALAPANGRLEGMINVENLAPGNYLLQVSCGGTFSRQLITVAH